MKNDIENKVYVSNTLISTVKKIRIISPVVIIMIQEKIHLPYYKG